jgi:hypothetical protein
MHGVSSSMTHRSFMDFPPSRAAKDWSCVGRSFVMSWPSSFIVPWWDHTMGCDGQLIDCLEGFHREAERVVMLDVFGVQLVEDSQRGLGTLVVASLELSCQV